MSNQDQFKITAIFERMERSLPRGPVDLSKEPAVRAILLAVAAEMYVQRAADADTDTDIDTDTDTEYYLETADPEVAKKLRTPKSFAKFCDCMCGGFEGPDGKCPRCRMDPGPALFGKETK